MYEQFPVAAHRKLHATGERAAQPRRWKSSLTVGDTKDLPQFRGRIHLRDLGLTKELMGLLQKQRVGRLAAERDPIQLRLFQNRSIARCDQSPQQRGRGGQDRDALFCDCPCHTVGIARGRHNELATSEHRLHPHLRARPPRGVVNEQPCQGMPLFGEPGRRQDRIPRMFHELRGAAGAGGGHHKVRWHCGKLPTLRTHQPRRQRERIIQPCPIAELSNQIARVVGQQGQRHVLPPAGRGDHHERIHSLRTRHDANRSGRIELLFQRSNRRGKRCVVDRVTALAPSPSHNGYAFGALAGHEANRRGEPVVHGRIGQVRDGSGVSRWNHDG